MVMRNRISTPESKVSKTDLIQASKAIYDELKTSMNMEFVEVKSLLADNKSFSDQVKSALASRFDDVEERVRNAETKMVVRVGKTINDEITRILEKKLEDLELNLVARVSKTFEDEFSKRLDNILGRFESKVSSHEEKVLLLKNAHEIESSQIKSLLQSLSLPVPQVNVSIPEYKSMDERMEERVAGLQKAYEGGLFEMKEMLSIFKSMPSPVVNVTMPSQEAPTVNVTMPEQKALAAPIVTVNVPEQKAPVVTVNVPEQKAPEVTVQVPQPRLVTKHLVYDEYGRPSVIEERESS